MLNDSSVSSTLPLYYTLKAMFSTAKVLIILPSHLRYIMTSANSLTIWKASRHKRAMLKLLQNVQLQYFGTDSTSDFNAPHQHFYIIYCFRNWYKNYAALYVRTLLLYGNSCTGIALHHDAKHHQHFYSTKNFCLQEVQN